MATTAEQANEHMARARRGEPRALGAVYDAYAAELYRKIILPRCGDADGAQEALAETFRTVIAQVHQYEPHPHGPWPWLVRIASTKAIDVLRARQRKARALTQFVRLVQPLLSEAPAADAETCERERAALRAEVQRAVAALRPRYRQAIELRFFDEVSREACAERMQITIGNFDVLLLRALRALRAAWEPGNNEEAP